MITPFIIRVQNEMTVLIKTASAPDIENPTLLDPLLATAGWQTLVTIAQESGGKSHRL